MSARSRLIGMLCLLVPLALACDRSSRSSDSRDGTALESPQARDKQSGALVLAGQLRTVDPDNETMIVAFGDDLYEFSYNDNTVIVGGTAKVQGLTGNTGDQITVHYRENPITSSKTAVRIELQQAVQ